MDLFFVQKLLSNTCNFRIRQKGSSGLEINFDALIKYFNDHNEVSTVSINHENVVNDDVRKSKKLSNIEIIMEKNHDDARKFNKLIKKIIPPNFGYVDYRTPYKGHTLWDGVDIDNDWDMLVYDENDFFTRHTDGKASNEHFCTLLLIPPQLSSYDGGDLILYDGSNKTVIVADSTNWLLVGFLINVEHECTPITRGKRIVFKTKFVIPSRIYDTYSVSNIQFNDNSEQNTPETVDTANDLEALYKELDLIVQSKKELKKEFKKKMNLLEGNELKMENKINVAEQNLVTYQYDNLLDAVAQSDKHLVIIVLERRYDTIDPNYLIGEDRRLFTELLKKIPIKVIKLINNSVNHDMDDEKPNKKCEIEPYSRYNFPDLLYSYSEDREYQLLFQNNESYNVPGKLISRSLEYNDSTYDSVYEFLITSILIVK